VQLPAIQYGDWKAVKKRMARVVTLLKRGADLVEVMTVDGMLDTTTTQGMLVIAGIQSGPVPHFHCFAPWKPALDSFAAAENSDAFASIEDAIFDVSLRSSWGVLGLLSTENQFWLLPASRHRPLLHAAIKVWPELDAVGARYYAAVQGERLWSVPNNLHYVMSNLGVPTDVLRAPLPPEGPRALLKYVRPVN
jgi:hypothetical protein